jgi:hypothetical protein
MDSIAAHWELCFDRCSITIRTALSFTSGGKGLLGKFFLLMTPFSQMLESTANPGRFSIRCGYRKSAIRGVGE